MQSSPSGVRSEREGLAPVGPTGALPGSAAEAVNAGEDNGTRCIRHDRPDLIREGGGGKEAELSAFGCTEDADALALDRRVLDKPAKPVSTFSSGTSTSFLVGPGEPK
jgi:hypothetical protein